METPDQMLARLEKLGEEKVRALIGMRHFDSKALPLVKGWLERKHQEVPEAEVQKVLAEADREVEKTRSLLRRSSSGATRRALKAEENARRARRLAVVALIVASGAALVSFLSLFALVVR